MKIVIYTDDGALAKQVAHNARFEGHSVTLGSASRFSAAADVEKADEVWLTHPSAAVEAAYAGNATVKRLYENKIVEPAPEPNAPDVVEATAAEQEAPMPVRLSGSAKKRN